MGTRLLAALHELGGEIFDPGGGAFTKLCEAAGIVPTSNARNVAAVLSEAGHLTRTVNGRRTTRVTLTPSGLAVVDGVSAETDPGPPPTQGPTAPEPQRVGPAPTSTTKGVASFCLSGQHRLCAAVTCACDCHGRARSVA